MADLRPQHDEEAVGANHPTKMDVINRAWNVEHNVDGTHKIMYTDIKPVVNAAVNKLDVFAKSSGAFPDANNVIIVAIPDGNGYTYRFRYGQVASGTGQISMADAANYWSKGSLAAEIKTAWLYAIWSAADAGMVWALGGYSEFNIVPTTTTATDDDYFLLENGSAYTRVATDRCVCTGTKIRYQYNTADTPDHTIQASGENAPSCAGWNPKSDYGYKKNLATTVISGSDIAEYSAVSVVVKQSGKYFISEHVRMLGVGAAGSGRNYIKTGSATYGSAAQKAMALISQVPDYFTAGCQTTVYLNAGDTIHLGISVTASSGNRYITGDDVAVGATSLIFNRID